MACTTLLGQSLALLLDERAPFHIGSLKLTFVSSRRLSCVCLSGKDSQFVVCLPGRQRLTFCRALAYQAKIHTLSCVRLSGKDSQFVVRVPTRQRSTLCRAFVYQAKTHVLSCVCLSGKESHRRRRIHERLCRVCLELTFISSLRFALPIRQRLISTKENL